MPPLSAMPTQRRNRGLVQEVVDGLIRDISNGVIVAGSKLPSEAEIMRNFNVSRSVVREAISRLQANRMVQTRHGIGTFALQIEESRGFQLGMDPEALIDVLAMLELRVSLETEAAGLAAQRRTSENLTLMQVQLDSFRQCIHTGADTAPPDFGFHMEVAKATNNPHFIGLMGYLGSVVIPRTMVNTIDSAPEGRIQSVSKVYAEHETIFHAILNQDADSARAAMRSHFFNSKDRLKQSHSCT